MEKNILDDIGFDKEGDGKIILISNSSFNKNKIADNFIAIILVTILFVLILSYANLEAIYGLIVVFFCYILVLLPLFQFIYSDYVKSESTYELRGNSMVINQPHKTIHINLKRIKYILSMQPDSIELGFVSPMKFKFFGISYKKKKIVLGPMEYKFKMMKKMKELTGLK